MFKSEKRRNKTMMMTMVRRMMWMNPMMAWSMGDCARKAWGQTTSTCSPAEAQAQSILDTAKADPSFGTLRKALEIAGLAELLKGDGPFTVFAPADSSFSALPAGALDELLKPENRSKLAATLKYHVAPGRILSSEIATLEAVRTFAGKDVRVRTQGGVVLLDNVLVVKPDIRCSNGVIHVIDGVLAPA
jgi:transforming growth factor-beta-induced protein